MREPDVICYAAKETELEHFSSATGTRLLMLKKEKRNGHRETEYEFKFFFFFRLNVQQGPFFVGVNKTKQTNK